VDSDGEFVSSSDVRTALVAIVGRPGLVSLQYVDIGGRARVEGCIDIGRTDLVHAETELLRGNSSAVRDAIRRGAAIEVRGTGIKQLRYRWDGKRVPYTIDESLPRPERVQEALDVWHKASGFNFAVRTNESNYVTFRPGSGCSSSVGMQGGQQFVTLGAECTMGNCIHEIGHTLGLWHEQSRIDRDLYVRVLLQNVKPGLEHNFYQHIDDGIDLGAYDYDSIMHYPATAFSKNGQPTIEPVTARQIGQRDHLSAGDIQAIADLYA
jgi:hypothetical protein